MTKAKSTKKETKETITHIEENHIDKLLYLLNVPETKSTFWKVNEPHAHIMGIRPIIRTTVEIINENGFNPYENKIKENLFKVFKIFISKIDDEINIQEDIKLKNDIEKNGIIYIKHHDLIYIYESIKESK